ncbi:hypothetical protein BDN72DRAFT_834623 [Pluteus cervinus]|uniref:Uncharacterized protein n=1 Tax=Pluteus cervinus TaxID=181527 RepID=A0ACD3B5W5_9AGAR|nr:hypothetical protein BDN72DRAFT_834623 [Pluteus cervinus]
MASALASWASKSCSRSTFRLFSRRPYSSHVAPVTSPRSILEDDSSVIDLSEDSDVVNGARPNTPPVHLRTPPNKPTPTEWKQHREVMKENFPDGWSPPRKLSREAMDGLRQLHHFDPDTFTTPVLADKFRISPEAVRRILKSKWEPPTGKRAKLAERERQERSEAIKLNRMKERIEARRLAELKGASKRFRTLGGGDLVSGADRFTFE